MYFFYKIVLLLCMCGSVFQLSVFAQSREDRSYMLITQYQTRNYIPDSPEYLHRVVNNEDRIRRVNDVPFVWRINGLVPNDAVNTMHDDVWLGYKRLFKDRQTGVYVQDTIGNFLRAKLLFYNDRDHINYDKDIAVILSLYNATQYNTHDNPAEQNYPADNELLFRSANVCNRNRNRNNNNMLYNTLHRCLYNTRDERTLSYTDTEMVAVCSLLGITVNSNENDRANNSQLKKFLLADGVQEIHQMVFALYSKLDPCWRCSTLLHDFADIMNNAGQRLELFQRLYGVGKSANALKAKFAEDFCFYVEVISDQPYFDSVLAGLDRTFFESIHNHFENLQMQIPNNNNVVCRRYDWSSYVRPQ